MSALPYVLTYFLTATVFFAIDMVWLGVIAKNIYQKHLGAFLSDNVNWYAALIFYSLFIVGILIFSVIPFKDDVWYKALLYGVLFGFFTYATYDLTNYATLQNWPFIIVVVDIVWGMVITGITATAAWYILNWLR
jgi:uncharacterized membrane protein